MKISRNRVKEIVKETMVEENAYQEFFKKALEKTGKSIPEMSEDEKKTFFNKIDSAWKGKGEKKESVNEGISVFDERHFGKKGIIIMIDDNGKKISAIFKDKKNADKYNRNKPSDIQALLKIAKTKPFGKAIDESVNESSPKVGRKSFYTQDNIGSSKYSINPYDGKSTHKDGSPFYGIKTFKNKVEYETAKQELIKKGYIEESVNEEKISVGSKVVINYPTLKAPIKGKVTQILKSNNGNVYVIGKDGVWDEKYVTKQ